MFIKGPWQKVSPPGLAAEGRERRGRGGQSPISRSRGGDQKQHFLAGRQHPVLHKAGLVLKLRNNLCLLSFVLVRGKPSHQRFMWPQAPQQQSLLRAAHAAAWLSLPSGVWVHLLPPHLLCIPSCARLAVPPWQEGRGKLIYSRDGAR